VSWNEQLEHEIFRKALRVALNLFVEAFGGDAIEGGELGIQQHAMTAQDEDGARDLVGRDQGLKACHGGRP
jgi:hypothetical protein